MEKIRLLLYCTKNKPDLVKEEEELYKKGLTGNNKYNTYNTNERGSCGYTLNGKIVAECDFEVEHLYNAYSPYRENDIHYFDTDTLNEKELMKRSCLSNLELTDYFKNKNGKAIHIKNLKERVMELSDCYKEEKIRNTLYSSFITKKPITKAPQNMCRVWIYEDGKWVMYILISVRPEWICLELNGIKDVEVRKRVLKEMVK